MRSENGELSSPGQLRSFTLIELVVVAAVMALAVGLAAVRLDGVSQRGRLQAAVRQVAAIHSLAQLEAVSSGQPRSVVYQIGAGHGTILRPELVAGEWAWQAGAPMALGHRVTVAGVAMEGPAHVASALNETCSLRLRSDGCSASYVVIVTTGAQPAAAVIDGVTGRCEPVLDPPRGAIDHPLLLLETER